MSASSRSRRERHSRLCTEKKFASGWTDRIARVPSIARLPRILSIVRLHRIPRIARIPRTVRILMIAGVLKIVMVRRIAMTMRIRKYRGNSTIHRIPGNRIQT